jgi:Ala-tRNA(Pro) deacylase
MQVSEIYTTAPSADRSAVEIETYALLDQLGISYERVEHGPANTMEDCEDIDRALNTKICKNLFLCNRQKTQFYLLAMPPQKPFFTKELGKQIGSSRLSFAPEEFLMEFTKCSPGSATVLGLMHDTEHRVHLIMDRETYEAPFFCCHPCICTSTVKMKTADVLEIFLRHTGHTVTVVDLPEYPS